MTYTPTTAEITRLRLLTGENGASSDWTTEALTSILTDRNGDVYAAASDVWTYKAAALASNPTSFSADGGSYNFQDAYERCLAEAARCLAMSETNGGMIIDPTLGEVEE